MNIRCAAVLLLLVGTTIAQQAVGQEPPPPLLSIPAVREALQPSAEFLVHAYDAQAAGFVRTISNDTVKADLREYIATFATTAVEGDRFADSAGGLNLILQTQRENPSLSAFGEPSCSYVIANRVFDTSAEGTGTVLSLAARRWTVANTRVVERNTLELINGLLRVAEAYPTAVEEAVQAALGRQRGALYAMREDVDAFLKKYRQLSSGFEQTLYGWPAPSAATLGAVVNPMLVSALTRALPRAGSDQDRARRIAAAIQSVGNSGVRLNRTSSTGCNTEGPGVITSGAGNASGAAVIGLYQQLARTAYLYQAIWSGEAARLLDVDSPDLRPAMAGLHRLNRDLVDRIASFRAGFLPLVQSAPRKPRMDIGQISWEEGDEKDHDVWLSGPAELAWNSVAEYELILVKTGESVKWYPIVTWRVEVSPATAAALDEALARKAGVGARVTTDTPRSTFDEAQLVLVAQYEDNFGKGEVRKNITISNVAAECEKLIAAIERLQPEIETESEQLEVQKVDLQKRLELAEEQIEMANKELARTGSADPPATLEETKKVITASQDVIKTLRQALVGLTGLRRDLYSALPDGARFHLANELFKQDPDNPQRRKEFVKAITPAHTGAVTDVELEVANKIVKDGLTSRFGLGLVNIGQLITIMVPRVGVGLGSRYAGVYNLFQVVIGKIADSIIDPTSFLDRPALRNLSKVTGKLKAALVRMNRLGVDVQKTATELDRLIKAGGSQRAIEAQNAKLVRLIKDMIRSIDTVQGLAEIQLADTEGFLAKKKAELAEPQARQRNREERRQEVEEAIVYLEEERDALQAQLGELDTTKLAQINKLKAELAQSQKDYDEKCGDR